MLIRVYIFPLQHLFFEQYFAGTACNFFADQTAQKQDCIVHADAHEAFSIVSERTRVRRNNA